MQNPVFSSREEYARHFTDIDYWRPYVEAICARHHLKPATRMRPGLPGSNPVFIVDESYVVKIYTHLFGGAESSARELELYSLFARFPQLPFPILLTFGTLFPEGQEWHWPYIVISVIPGASIGELSEQIQHEDKLALASYLGPLLYKLHNLPLNGLQSFKPSWDSFVSFLEQQRLSCVENHKRWKALPTSLISQIEDYLPPVQTLIDQRSSPVLRHGDLNQDHILGYLKDGHWQTTGIIDFGDARIGDRLYELIALHMGLFHEDKTLLRAFLEGYGIDRIVQKQFVHKAMSYTLLFEFDVLSPIFQETPSLRRAASLAKLADLLWDIE